MSDAETPHYVIEFQRKLDSQPYDVELEGLQLTIDKDVFPPDWGRCARNMARLAVERKPSAALDLGCGSGFMALYMKKNGVPEVWASDIHGPAIACTLRNVHKNPGVGPVHVVQGDLFGGVPAEVAFDLVVFNQPFGPGPPDRPCGCGPDGGREIVERCLQNAPAHLKPGGAVMMAFSDRQVAQNDPKSVAERLGWQVETLLHLYYDQANNFVYLFRP